MKPILITLLILFTISCSEEKEIDCCVNIDLGANISLKNASGDDLLDPENPNSFNETNIKTYYLIDGVEKRVGADDVLFLNEEGIYIFRTFVNYKGNDQYPITYIDWNETNRDTIKSEIYRTDNQIRVTKIWLNGELMWDVADGGAAYFTIVK